MLTTTRVPGDLSHPLKEWAFRSSLCEIEQLILRYQEKFAIINNLLLLIICFFTPTPAAIVFPWLGFIDS